ncbi:MAG: hypothetical protein K6G73_01225 [Marinilabiliaceae bacterium]|nr:hypothetical protein [Marinilabiliaceae bacterium]
MKKVFVYISILAACITTKAQDKVTHDAMQKIYDEVRTPYKYGMVIVPQDNGHKIDCPTVFRKDGRWYMTYVCYNGHGGTDGRGYETWIATSDDLLHWQTEGRVLEYSNDTASWDANQRGGFPALIDMNWGGSYEIGTHKGKHYMTYIGGHGKGYEAVYEPLSIGVATTNDDITKPWSTAIKPLMRYDDKDAQWWERLTQYKSTIYSIDKKIFGYPYVMFYNAGGKDDSHPKGERIGIALSKDMKKWKRYNGNPVFAHDTDGTITGDAQIVKMDNLWVMFYFSAFNPAREYNAYNTFAVSRDLVHWQDWDGEDLIYPSKPYDEMFAHKSYVVKWQGVVYHFYCAVNNSEQRGIAVATSKHMGQSELHFVAPDAKGHRTTQSLNDDWQIEFGGKKISHSIPINLDDYYGARQLVHGNLHGEATFTKHFVAPDKGEKEYFLNIEGIGTYADITLNGIALGRYDIGRLTKVVDITNAVKKDAENELVINVSHPSGITDMPWVCGGCSSEWGYSEGSQPFGIFRPITLEVTDKVRIEPFGVHAWSNALTDSIFINTEIKNYGSEEATFSLINKLCDKSGKQIVRLTENVMLKAGETKTIHQRARIENVHLWSVENPYLYNVNTIIKRNGKATESTNTAFGFRTISWPKTRNDGDKRFILNGKPTFINGVCEYEHEFGQSHAFSNEQIKARIKETISAGFNAFRDAHQPHNLLYGKLIEENGLLWWPQFSAHIWYDTPAFRENFKRHLRQWVKERRNSPSVILWGLQNESTLPPDFARECCDIIRELDPTCGSQRLVTTCNGGEGSDWNVVQNWSGTYGGNIDNYGNELKDDAQLLNGEYGAWRTIGNHTGNGYTEEKFCDILSKKIDLAESVRDSVCGQFQWLLVSHDNPGRKQPDEGLRRIDKVGPFNHKGIFSIWEQPTDAFYMYKSKYVSADREPFVYRTKSGIVYTNCPQTRVRLEGNVEYIDGLLEGNVVCTYKRLTAGELTDDDLLQPKSGVAYTHRINCGGDRYTDAWGNEWTADDSLICHSWANDFDGMNAYSASQTADYDMPVLPLFQTSRYGRHRMSYKVAAHKGTYRVELYFVEPWYGKGCGEQADYEGLRIFDVAINDSTVIDNLDIWAQAHYGKTYKRVVEIVNEQDSIEISFPEVRSGQAIISAIAIARMPETPGGWWQNLDKLERIGKQSIEYGFWHIAENDTITKMPDNLLPPRADNSLKVSGKKTRKGMQWTFTVGVAKIYAIRWRYHNAEAPRKLHVTLSDQNGVIYKDDDVSFLQTQAKKTKRKMTSITTGSFINAGTYTLTLTGEGIQKMTFDELTIE